MAEVRRITHAEQAERDFDQLQAACRAALGKLTSLLAAWDKRCAGQTGPRKYYPNTVDHWLALQEAYYRARECWGRAHAALPANHPDPGKLHLTWAELIPQVPFLLHFRRVRNTCKDWTYTGRQKRAARDAARDRTAARAAYRSSPAGKAAKQRELEKRKVRRASSKEEIIT